MRWVANSPDSNRIVPMYIAVVATKKERTTNYAPLMAHTVRDFSPNPSWRNSTFERQPRHRPRHQKSNHHQRHPRFRASFSTALVMTGQTRISLYFFTASVCWIETSQSASHLLTAFSTAGDTHISFKNLGKALKLPQTAVLSLRAPEQ
jgi:hypothetical protein